eukprot:1679361-Pleurochrysis_carterae.AAC.1
MEYDIQQQLQCSFVPDQSSDNNVTSKPWRASSIVVQHDDIQAEAVSWSNPLANLVAVVSELVVHLLTAVLYTAS